MVNFFVKKKKRKVFVVETKLPISVNGPTEILVGLCAWLGPVNALSFTSAAVTYTS